MMKSLRKTCPLLALALLLLATGVMAADPISTIGPGNTVFLGEAGLDITPALNGAYYGVTCTGETLPGEVAGQDPALTQIGWWASAADIHNTPPSRTIDTGSRSRDMMIAPSDFAGYTGNWYLLGQSGMAWSPQVEGCGCTASGCSASRVFSVQDPNLDIRVYDATLGVDATANGWITTGSEVEFRITTNLYQMTQRSGVAGAPVTIKVQSPDGATFTALINKAGSTTGIVNMPVSTSPFSTGRIWDTGRTQSYPVGTYRIWAECNANSMKDNYPVGGKTYTPMWGLLDQERNPSISVTTRTATPTAVATSAPATVTTVMTTTLPATTTPPATVMTTLPTASPTAPQTEVPTTAPTKSPGFESVLAGAALLLTLAWSARKE
jgi:hypothetical protein